MRKWYAGNCVWCGTVKDNLLGANGTPYTDLSCVDVLIHSSCQSIKWIGWVLSQCKTKSALLQMKIRTLPCLGVRVPPSKSILLVSMSFFFSSVLLRIHVSLFLFATLRLPPLGSRIWIPDPPFQVPLLLFCLALGAPLKTRTCLYMPFFFFFSSVPQRVPPWGLGSALPSFLRLLHLHHAQRSQCLW